MTPTDPSKQAAEDGVLESFVHRWASAIVANDVEQMERFVTDDWVLIEKPGVISRDTFHGLVADGVLRHTTMSHDILDIRHLGPGVAVVRTHGRNAGSFQGDLIEADEWTTNILVRSPEGWRCALTQLTPRVPG